MISVRSEVQILPGPPNRMTADRGPLSSVFRPADGGVAQLGEHLLCKQGVVGSSPITSTVGKTDDSNRMAETRREDPNCLRGIPVRGARALADDNREEASCVTARERGCRMAALSAVVGRRVPARSVFWRDEVCRTRAWAPACAGALTASKAREPYSRGICRWVRDGSDEKGIWWMPWR